MIISYFIIFSWSVRFLIICLAVFFPFLFQSRFDNIYQSARIAQWFLPDIVISDIRMPQMDGLAFAGKLIRRNPDSKLGRLGIGVFCPFNVGGFMVYWMA